MLCLFLFTIADEVTVIRVNDDELIVPIQKHDNSDITIVFEKPNGAMMINYIENAVLTYQVDGVEFPIPENVNPSLSSVFYFGNRTGEVRISGVSDISQINAKATIKPSKCERFMVSNKRSYNWIEYDFDQILCLSIFTPSEDNYWELISHQTKFDAGTLFLKTDHYSKFSHSINLKGEWKGDSNIEYFGQKTTEKFSLYWGTECNFENDTFEGIIEAKETSPRFVEWTQWGSWKPWTIPVPTTEGKGSKMHFPMNALHLGLITGGSCLVGIIVISILLWCFGCCSCCCSGCQRHKGTKYVDVEDNNPIHYGDPLFNQTGIPDVKPVDDPKTYKPMTDL